MWPDNIKSVIEKEKNKTREIQAMHVTRPLKVEKSPIGSLIYELFRLSTRWGTFTRNLAQVIQALLNTMFDNNTKGRLSSVNQQYKCANKTNLHRY